MRSQAGEVQDLLIFPFTGVSEKNGSCRQAKGGTGGFMKTRALKQQEKSLKRKEKAALKNGTAKSGKTTLSVNIGGLASAGFM